MPQSVEIYDDSESISVSDIAVYSLDINDILAGGTIAISSAVSILDGGTITTTPTIENVTPEADTNVKVFVTVDSPNTINITIGGSNEVLITDNVAFPVGIAFGPQGETGVQGDTGVQGETGPEGPAGVGSFPELTLNPFTVVGNNVGLNIINPQYELELSSTLFSPVVSSSAVAINGNGASDLFIVKAQSSEETKFVINLQGVTILGQFQTTPTAVSGGMFYSASGDFYLGT